MKKINFIFSALILSVLFFSSCQKEDLTSVTDLSTETTQSEITDVQAMEALIGTITNYTKNDKGEVQLEADLASLSPEIVEYLENAETLDLSEGVNAEIELFNEKGEKETAVFDIKGMGEIKGDDLMTILRRCVGVYLGSGFEGSVTFIGFDTITITFNGDGSISILAC